MSLVELLDREDVNDNLRELYDQAESKYGLVPNLWRALANSPSCAEAATKLYESLEDTALEPRIRELAFTKVAMANNCEY